MSTKANVVAIDIGGTSIRCALVDSEFNIVDRTITPTDNGSLDQLLENSLTELLERNLTKFISGVTAGIPEFVSDGRATSSMVIDWKFSTVQLIESTIKKFTGNELKLNVESDVRCGAIGESNQGGYGNNKSLLYISWGTGISSTLVLSDGNCWQGARGEAIALGEWRVLANNKVSTLEKTVSGLGLSQNFKELTGHFTSAEAIQRLVDSKDPIATELFDSAAFLTGMAIADLVHVLDPDLVVLGGGIGSAKSSLTAATMSNYKSRDDGRGWPKIYNSNLKNDAGLIGASVIAFERK